MHRGLPKREPRPQYTGFGWSGADDALAMETLPSRPRVLAGSASVTSPPLSPLDAGGGDPAVERKREMKRAMRAESLPRASS
eukprot:4599228-Prymnesium_polylepis.1